MKVNIICFMLVLFFSGLVFGAEIGRDKDDVFDFTLSMVEKLDDPEQRDVAYKFIALAYLELKDFARVRGIYPRITDDNNRFAVLEKWIRLSDRKEDYEWIEKDIATYNDPVYKTMMYYKLMEFGLFFELGKVKQLEILEKLRKLKDGLDEEELADYWDVALMFYSLLGAGEHQGEVEQMLAEVKLFVQAHPQHPFLVESLNRAYIEIYGKIDDDTFKVWRKAVGMDFCKTVSLAVFLRRAGLCQKAKLLLNQALEELPGKKYSLETFIQLSECLSKVDVRTDCLAAQFLGTDILFVDRLLGSMAVGQFEPNHELWQLAFKGVIQFLFEAGYEEQVKNTVSKFGTGDFRRFCEDLVLYFHTQYCDVNQCNYAVNVANIHSRSLSVDLALKGAEQLRKPNKTIAYKQMLHLAANMLKKKDNDCFTFGTQEEVLKECILGDQLKFAEEVSKIKFDGWGIIPPSYLLGVAYVERGNIHEAQKNMVSIPEDNCYKDYLEAEIAGQLFLSGQTDRSLVIFKKLIQTALSSYPIDLDSILFIYVKAKKTLMERSN